MPCTVNDFVVVANELSAFSSSRSLEGTYRASVNRHYYASYHSANFVATVWGIDLSANPGNFGVHARLVHAMLDYDMEHKQLINKIGNRLSSLKAVRHKADYRLESNIDRMTVNNAKSTRDEIVNLCSKALQIKNFIPTEEGIYIS